MDKDLRASLVAAGAATVLSALVGAIAGVGFLTLLLRALGSGLFIGAAVYGGIILVRKTVLGGLAQNPEFVEAEPYVHDDALKGGKVDIVLPGEDVSPDSFGSGDEPLSEYTDQPPIEPLKAYEDPPSGEGGTEKTEKAAATGGVPPAEVASLLEPEGSGIEAPAAMPMGAGHEKDSRPSGGYEDLDVLPDLEGYSDSFNASEFASGGAPSNKDSKGHAGQAGPGGRSGQEGFDPASLAQAVRTILKRDQKG